ncbi:GMC oxidoreductase [Microbacterium sp. 22242]|uniref:GMC oxidoreductase n=1 Tax=Microbacterium sp. 22242 TaxID=3453896 RepID=UPI003F852A6C
MSRYPAAVDVAIVGSGPNGAAYARILSEEAPEAVIAMFEVGPTVSAPAGAHVKNIVDAEERRAAQAASQGPARDAETVSSPGAVKAGARTARPGTYLLEDGFRVDGEDGLPVIAFSSNVGGMGAHWTGACPRPGGSERIPFLPDLDELLDEADRLLGVTTDAFDDAPFTALVRERLADAVDPGREEGARVQRMPLAVHRREDGALVWSGSDVVMGDVTRANPNFALHDETLVLRVLLEDGRAAGVEVQDRRTGEKHTVRARFVVVAADGLRTAQVLYASGIRPAALGRMLNDQAQVVYAARIADAAEVAARAGGASGESFGERDVIDGAISEQSGVSWVPYTDEEPFHGQIMQLDASPVPLADEDPVVPGSIVGLGLFTAKDLQWDDRVEFRDDATDAYGLPAMRIRYRLTARDHEVLDRARARIVELAEAVGEPLGERPFTMPPGASLHYQGATRMGASDDGRSVCGPDSEVWGAPGVFVAGNNVIPTATACNPTLTSVALGIRGARSIVRRLS